MTVYMSVARHESYERYNAQFPITASGIADAWLSGPILEAQSAPIDIIYASPLPRAKATAMIRGKAVNCHNLNVDISLHEKASIKDICSFFSLIQNNAAQENYQHIHVVTHQPVLMALGEYQSPVPGVIYLHQAEDWQNMMSGNFEVLRLPPIKEKLFAMQFEAPQFYDVLSAQYAALTNLAQQTESTNIEDIIEAYASAEQQRTDFLVHKSHAR